MDTTEDGVVLATCRAMLSQVPKQSVVSLGKLLPKPPVGVTPLVRALPDDLKRVAVCYYQIAYSNKPKYRTWKRPDEATCMLLHFAFIRCLEYMLRDTEVRGIMLCRGFSVIELDAEELNEPNPLDDHVFPIEPFVPSPQTREGKIVFEISRRLQ